MNRWKFAILALILLGALPGCLPNQQDLSLQRDMAEMKRRLAANERGLAALRQEGQGQKRLDALARQQAGLQASIDSLRVDLQTVQGRLQDAGDKRAQLRQQISLMRKDLDLKLKALEGRVGKLEAREQAQASPPPAPVAAETPEDLYHRGLDLVRKKEDYAGGRKVLKDFLGRYPKNKLAPNALYWIGETYYGQKKYENAILQFQDVIQNYGDNPKAAAALLKQGMAFQALGDNKNAGVIWQKLIDTYPKSEEAKMARKDLAAIKGAR